MCKGLLQYEMRNVETPWNKLRPLMGAIKRLKPAQPREKSVQRKPLEMVSFPGLAWGRKAKVITVDIWKISALCFATKAK